MKKIKLRVLQWDSIIGELRLEINDKVYAWYSVSPQYMEELHDDIDNGKNKGKVLKRLERQYGKGRRLVEIKEVKDGS